MEYIGRAFLVFFLVRWAFVRFSTAQPELAADLKQRAGDKAKGWLTSILK